ncbi:MAG: (d)CMP kinase [Mariprofundaceae bacterium]|nr:(d)CMP kinase [Mariprofundaceae bacterium]
MSADKMNIVNASATNMHEWTPVPGLQIAVDGPSGSGKGTIASLLAEAIGLPVLDTGLLYRFIGYSAMQENDSLDSETAILALLDDCLKTMQWQPGGIVVNGDNINNRLRKEDVAAAASRVAVMPEVRKKLLYVQRDIAGHGCVMDGRDIGTVVLPDAQAKFFLTASLHERARRRWAQLQGMDAEVSLDATLHEIRERDTQDAERTHAPLKQARDAVCIDSTTLRIDEVVDRMLVIMERRQLIRQS